MQRISQPSRRPASLWGERRRRAIRGECLRMLQPLRNRRLAAALLAPAAIPLAVLAASGRPKAPSAGPPGMRWIPGGEFTMGSDSSSQPNERPAHRVRVSGFWIDETPVTNAEFARFVKATGYVTVAERKPEWEELKKELPPGTPPPDPSQLV